MIVHTADGGRRELFARFDSSVPIPRPSQWGGALAWSGARINLEGAAGLPAFLRALRLISETAAALPWTLYRGFGQQKTPQPNASQLQLLHRPNPDVASSAAFWQYAYMCLPGAGNAYIRKLKVRGRIKFLYTLDPRTVTPKYEGAGAIFEVRSSQYGPIREELTKADLIHIPGILLQDPYVGMSVVAAHRNEIGNQIGRSEFEGRYIRNDAQPGVILKHPGNPKREQRQEVREGFDARHAGAAKAGRTGMMWGGWDLEQLPVSLAEAQFIESKRYGLVEIANMTGVPSGLLNDGDAPGQISPEHENMRLLQHGVAPWMDRLWSALAADTDLFPESDWCVEQDDHGFLRADIQTRFNAYRLGRQGGWLTPNEIRGWEGFEPAKGGDEIQQTPVGGQANANANPGGGGNADQ